MPVQQRSIGWEMLPRLHVHEQPGIRRTRQLFLLQCGQSTISYMPLPAVPLPIYSHASPIIAISSQQPQSMQQHTGHLQNKAATVETTTTMAAALAMLNHYFQNTLLIANAPIQAALNAQGLQNIDDFLTLMDDDIGDICTNARKPGGTIPNPAHNLANPVAGIPVMIPHLGILIGHMYQKWLKMLCYYVHHLVKIQCTFNAGQATLACLTQLYHFSEQEEQYDNGLPCWTS